VTKYYRVIFEEYDVKPTSATQDNIIIEGAISAPENCLDFGIRHKEQMELISKVQDKVLQLQASETHFKNDYCPKCSDGVLKKHGFNTSWFYDVFSDHRVTLPRRRCNKCKHVATNTVQGLLGQSLSGELIKIQSELGAQYSYRDSERLINRFSSKKRRINNHEKIHATSEQVGESLSNLNQIEEEILSATDADELIVHVDGGHIKSTEENQRSFEAMTSVVYQPNAITPNIKNTRNTITSKHCAASAMSDSQEQMKRRTIIAALKQGMTPQTKITALCDGADNCWNIIDALEPMASSIDRILDWFHLGMKLQNISLPESLKTKLMRIKWHLWRGRSDLAIKRLDGLMLLCSEKPAERLNALKVYISNNESKIINYRDRQKQGLPFTSHLAESTVESLINQRCKGQQHMRWSREGLDPILQIRAAIASNDWDQNWRTVIASI
jgi:ribosomal protein S27AE